MSVSIVSCALLGFDRQDHRAGFAIQRDDLRSGLDRHSPLLERPGEGLPDLGVGHRHQRVEHLDHRDVHAEGVEHVGELHPHVTAAHHDHALRQIPEGQGLATSDHLVAVDFEARERHHGGAGGDHDIRGLDHVGIAFLGSDFDGPRPRDATATLEHFDLVLLEQEADSARELLADEPTSIHGGAHVVDHVLGPHAHFLAVRLEVLRQRCALEKRLGRDAAPVEARAAHPAFVGGRFDAAGLQAQLRRPDRAYVAGRTGADHQYVELVSHRFRLVRFVPGTRRVVLREPVLEHQFERILDHRLERL